MAAQSGALPDGARLIDQPVAAGPFPVEAKRAWRKNLVLVGDAAGFYDGVTGEGMSLALVTARLCATAVDRFLLGDGEASFREYDRKRRALARNPRILGGLVLALAAHPGMGSRAVANLARHPETFAKLVSINQGERGLASLRPRDILAFLTGI
jgi:flavin-dependent dehydrogenase